jgi:hypothetical protein
LPPGADGALLAVRDYARRQYNDDPAAPRWAASALSAAIGWRLLQICADEGVDAAISLLYRLVEEIKSFSDAAVLADIATGIDLRRDERRPDLDRLASVAYTLAFTKIRGGGGWLAFAGRDRPDLWQRAVTLDAATARGLLAEQVLATIEGGSYGTFGITQALIAAFAACSPEPAGSGPSSAFACWDAAFQVIEHRLPGRTNYENGAYEPTADAASQSTTDLALADLALAALAMPARDDRRRALVATTALLAARSAAAQTAAAHVLAADLGAGPLTWLLTVLRDGLRDGDLSDDLADQLASLARGDLLSVRAVAAGILSNAGRQAPSPPGTAAHPALARAVADALAEEEG